MEFKPFSKIARLTRECIVTEKLDGTNASILIVPTKEYSQQYDHVASHVGTEWMIFAGSRNRFITPADDNYGFAKWVQTNALELLNLGPGLHFGEWWGAGIQRRYGLTGKRFSLFNVKRWIPDAEARTVEEWGKTVHRVKDIDGDEKCSCVGVVPVLYRGEFNTSIIDQTLEELRRTGSIAAPGFRDPEGIVIFHTSAGICFKKTFDDSPKGV